MFPKTNRFSSRQRRELVGVSALVMAIAAQTAPAIAQSTQSLKLDDVVVTAQRRKESIQKSSVAIEVLNAQQLSRVVNPRDLTTLTPGVQIGMGGAATQIYVRGVGDQSNNMNSNPGVAVNLDGVYIARPAAVGGNFYDLQRVEILKGPQGTLYGRNASGGAINLITHGPQLGVYTGDLSLEVGNYGLVKGNLAVNVPITADLAVRGAFQGVSRNSYLVGGGDDDHEQEGRITGLWKPNSDLSVTFGGDYADVGGIGTGFVPIRGSSGAAHISTPWTSVSDPSVSNTLMQQYAYQSIHNVPGPPTCIPSASLPDLPQYQSAPQGYCPVGEVSTLNPLAGSHLFQNNHFWGVHAQMDWNLGFANLTLLPSYRDSRPDYTTTATDAHVIHLETSQETSLEARLSNANDFMKWVGGLYFYHELQTAPSAPDFGLLNDVLSNYTQQTNSYAGFGQTTVTVAPRLRLIAGARYTYDKHSMSQGYFDALPGSLNYLSLNNYDTGQPCIASYPATCRIEDNIKGSAPFYSFTWKLGAEYDITPVNMLYATASTGFKDGGVQIFKTSLTAPASQYAPEKLLNFELGARNTFDNGRLVINPDLFYDIYRDHQGFAVAFDSLNLPELTILNDGDARMYGAELDVVDRLSPNDTARFGGQYEDAQFTKSIFPLNVGEPLILTPRWSANFAYQHSLLLANGSELTGEFDLIYASSRWLSTNYNLPQALDPAYVTEDVTLTYTPAVGNWTAKAYVHNLSNEVYYTQAITGSFAAAPYVSLSGNIDAPRTYGGVLSYHF